MVIVCVPWSERGRLGCFTTDEESIGRTVSRIGS